MTTTTQEKSPLEKVGEAWSTDQMFKVRAFDPRGHPRDRARVKPGMVEEDAVEMAQDILAERGMVQGWHDVYVRFGTNTIKTFGEASDPGVVLGEDDIFLIDIGPVFEKWEGDGGDTFVTGASPENGRAAADARKLFHIVRKKWETEKATGQALYEFAVGRGRAHGLGAELGPFGPPDLGIPARGPLCRAHGRRRLHAIGRTAVGAGNPYPPPDRKVRRLFRGHAARGQLLSGLHGVVATSTNGRPRRGRPLSPQIP